MSSAVPKTALVFTVVLMFSTFLPATSIEGSEASYQKPGGRQQKTRIHSATTPVVQMGSSRMVLGTTLPMRERLSQFGGVDAGCGFSTPCYSVIRAPEPQSLLLVGSGLITMAGLIRRRVAR
jgi:hypothetical protein